ncbi:T9SS type A sorting domain-containing protein [Flavobacteriaceae bacterium]|nr:T9SS type A sorting domain-containing protein [Flavobacteriaceae bacterium]
MKKITLLLLAMISYVGFAQSTIDFETGGVGAAWTWTVDENDTNPALEFVANPNTTGNTSAMTAKLTTKAGGQAWALAYSDGIGSFTFDANNSLVKMMVRKTVATDVAIKFEIPNGINKEVKATTTVTNGDWEELSFDFSSVIGSTYSRIVIIPDFLARTTDNIVYFDQITFNAGTPPAVPTSGASAPTNAATDVYSFFGDTYTNTAPSSFSQSWGQGTVSDYTAGSDAVKKYAALNFQAITLSSTVNLSNYTHIHVDTWTPIANAVGIKFQDFGADNVDEYPNVDDSEFEVQSSTTQASQTWVGHDFPLSAFTGLTGTANLGQIQLLLGSATGGTQGDVYIDNLYLYTAPTAGLDDYSLSSIKMHPNPASGIVKFSTALGDALSVSVFDLLGKLVIPVQTIQSELNISNLNPGVYFVRMEQGASSITKKLLVK